MSYHLLSGIRHFFWDLGYGYEIKTANLSGIIVIIRFVIFNDYSVDDWQRINLMKASRKVDISKN